MATRYWVASLPVGQGASASSLWTRLQESISKQAFDTSLYRVFSYSSQISSTRIFPQSWFANCVVFVWIPQFNIPNLRVGTLDLLLSLSDDLSKASSSQTLADFVEIVLLIFNWSVICCFGRQTTLSKECRTKSGVRLRSWRGCPVLLVARLLWTGFPWTLILPGKIRCLLSSLCLWIDVC